MAYVETLMAEYAMSLPAVFAMPFSAGVALLEARRARLHPAETVGWIDRAIIRARNRARHELSRLYRVV